MRLPIPIAARSAAEIHWLVGMLSRHLTSKRISLTLNLARREGLLGSSLLVGPAGQEIK